MTHGLFRASDNRLRALVAIVSHIDVGRIGQAEGERESGRERERGERESERETTGVLPTLHFVNDLYVHNPWDPTTGHP